MSTYFNDPEDFRLWGLDEKVHLRIRHALQLGWTEIRWIDVTEQWVGIRPDKNSFRFRIPELPEETKE